MMKKNSTFTYIFRISFTDWQLSIFKLNYIVFQCIVIFMVQIR